MQDAMRLPTLTQEDLFRKSPKEQLCAWLTRNAIPWTPDMLKPELYELCKKFAPAPTFRLDQ